MVDLENTFKFAHTSSKRHNVQAARILLLQNHESYGMNTFLGKAGKQTKVQKRKQLISGIDNREASYGISQFCLVLPESEIAWLYCLQPNILQQKPRKVSLIFKFIANLLITKSMLGFYFLV